MKPVPIKKINLLLKADPPQKDLLGRVHEEDKNIPLRDQVERKAGLIRVNGEKGGTVEYFFWNGKLRKRKKMTSRFDRVLENECTGGSPWPPSLGIGSSQGIARSAKRGGHGGPPIH